MDDHLGRRQAAQLSAHRGPRRRYVPPSIGRGIPVRELTEGNAGSKGDGGPGQRRA